MRTCEFWWLCDAVWGEIELEISDEEVEMIKEAHRDAFDCLEDCSEFDALRERALQLLDFYEPDLGQDIRIYFPEEIMDEADEEDENEE